MQNLEKYRLYHSRLSLEDLKEIASNIDRNKYTEKTKVLQQAIYDKEDLLKSQRNDSGIKNTGKSVKRIETIEDLSYFWSLRTHPTVFNQTRFSLSVLGPVLIIFGIMGLMGYGETKVNNEIVYGTDRILADSFATICGVIMVVFRLTVFKTKITTKD